jgi:hypothetical protein
MTAAAPGVGMRAGTKLRFKRGSTVIDGLLLDHSTEVGFSLSYPVMQLPVLLLGM